MKRHKFTHFIYSRMVMLLGGSYQNYNYYLTKMYEKATKEFDNQHPICKDGMGFQAYNLLCRRYQLLREPRFDPYAL